MGPRTMKDAPSPEEQRLHRALCDYINQAVNSEKLRELAAAHGEWFDRWMGSRTMTDPVEEALRAIENKYYPDMIEGKCLMPFYPREDVRVMVSAAIAAEREACAKIADCEAEIAEDRGDLTAKAIAAAIRARGTT